MLSRLAVRERATGRHARSSCHPERADFLQIRGSPRFHGWSNSLPTVFDLLDVLAEAFVFVGHAFKS